MDRGTVGWSLANGEKLLRDTRGKNLWRGMIAYALTGHDIKKTLVKRRHVLNT